MKCKVISKTKGKGKIVELPVLKLWTCGDGCCSEWNEYMLDVVVGDIIECDFMDYPGYVTHETYQVGSNYTGYSWHNYRPVEDWDEAYFNSNLDTSLEFVQLTEKEVEWLEKEWIEED